MDESREGEREGLISLLETIFIKNSDVESLLTKDDLEGGAVYYRRLEKTVKLVFGDRFGELLQLVCPDNLESSPLHNIQSMTVEQAGVRGALDQVMIMFGDTFRSLSLLRDSLMFRVGVEETDSSVLQNELKKMGWGKAEKLLVLLTDRLDEIKRRQEGVSAEKESEDLEDFDEEIYEELKKAWGDLSVFMKVTEAVQQGLRKGKFEFSAKFFGMREKGEDQNLSLSLLFESGICPSDYPDLNIPTITWDNIQTGQGSSFAVELVAPTPNYYLELGQRYPDQMHIVTHLLWIIGSEKDIPFYETYFRHKDHVNYIGEEESVGPVAISIEADSGERPYVRAVVRTMKKDDRHLISSSLKPKEQIKALARGYPWINRVKFARFRDNQELNESLASFEKNNIVKTYKFGVLYRAAGQMTENEMFGNKEGSEDFEEFLDFLGERIVLKGWDKFRGGLDIKGDTTGQCSVYRSTANNIEVMFHVSTLLPFFPSDPQQLERKRHLGNDVVVIVFSEGEESFDPSEIRSEFNHIFFVISKVPSPKGSQTRYRVACAAKQGVDPFPPFLSRDKTFKKDNEFLDWLMTKLINSERVAMQSAPAFQMKMERTRRLILQQILNQCQEKRRA